MSCNSPRPGPFAASATVPPSGVSRSYNTTCLPRNAAVRAASNPAGPPPIMYIFRIYITANRSIDDVAYLATLIAGDARAYSFGTSLLRESRQVGVCNQCTNHLHTVSLPLRQDAFGLCCIHNTSGSEDRNVH